MNVKLGKFFKEWLIPFAIELVVVLLLVKYVFFFVIVPTGSMIPTILEHSFLFATRVHNPEKLERGDIVVFNSDELDKTLVKRLIGLPGETIVIDEEGQLTVGGVPLEESYVKNSSPASGEFQVPEGCYFFLGDNRRGSYDARGWENPYIPENKIEGKAQFTIWPVSKFGMLK